MPAVKVESLLWRLEDIFTLTMARVDGFTLYSPQILSAVLLVNKIRLSWVPSHPWLVSQARAGLNFGSNCEDKPRIPSCLCGCSFLLKFLFPFPFPIPIPYSVLVPISHSHSHIQFSFPFSSRSPFSGFQLAPVEMQNRTCVPNPILDKRALCMLCEQIYFSPFTDMFIVFLKCTAAILHVLIACTW